MSRDVVASIADRLPALNVQEYDEGADDEKSMDDVKPADGHGRKLFASTVSPIRPSESDSGASHHSCPETPQGSLESFLDVP